MWRGLVIPSRRRHGAPARPSAPHSPEDRGRSAADPQHPPGLGRARSRRTLRCLRWGHRRGRVRDRGNAPRWEPATDPTARRVLLPLRPSAEPGALARSAHAPAIDAGWRSSSSDRQPGSIRSLPSPVAGGGGRVDPWTAPRPRSPRSRSNGNPSRIASVYAGPILAVRSVFATSLPHRSAPRGTFGHKRALR